MVTHILNPDNSLSDWLTEQQFPAYRSKQIRRWLYQGRAGSFNAMSDLPKKLRDQIEKDYTIWTTKVVKHQKSKDGTEKLLLELADGGRIECVLLKEENRRTICISSQVGCAMGCVFCASGLDGVDRNLTSGEILEQMLRLQRLLPEQERLSHIVVMGMGEPLANLDRLLPALDQASAEDGLGISARRITISTVGLPKAIKRLADLNSRYHLAVSLHAPNDQLRDEIVPVNSNIGINKIIESADHYFDISSRRLTFEYVLLGDINDQPEHAHQLAKLLQSRNILLNVIPYNPVAGLPYRTPSSKTISEFRAILLRANINVQFRQRKGDDIDAACGQLRRKTADLHQIQPLN
ncbi:MAG: 23S rRNA (adenine(2503)-C(2))-methyltransferase RlmN [Planctomycetaceae bacterium]|nr:23S rRNA (adenine(2503)-C(2))-methyltransferase RlmN [Planctomycetaceae bacterium]